MLPKPYYQDDAVTIYHADCRDILPELPKVDLVLTDPPYGLLMGDSKEKRPSRHLMREHYESYNDTLENFELIVVPIIQDCISLYKNVALFTAGNRITYFPHNDALGGIYIPNATGSNAWGFNTFLPILFYGKDRTNKDGRKPLTISSTTNAEDNGHPCPKPFKWMSWLVSRTAVKNDLILDPFCGSGTTLIAAKLFHYKCIGIEIEEKYCEIAAKRCSQTVMPLFSE